jgi:hypothetical protein
LYETDLPAGLSQICPIADKNPLQPVDRLPGHGNMLPMTSVILR